MFKLFIVITLFFSLLVVAQMEQPTDSTAPIPTTQNNDEQQISNTDSFEVFVPSESILDDQSVDFPTDI